MCVSLTAKIDFQDIINNALFIQMSAYFAPIIIAKEKRM